MVAKSKYSDTEIEKARKRLMASIESVRGKGLLTTKQTQSLKKKLRKD